MSKKKRRRKSGTPARQTPRNQGQKRAEAAAQKTETETASKDLEAGSVQTEQKPTEPAKTHAAESPCEQKSEHLSQGMEPGPEEKLGGQEDSTESEEAFRTLERLVEGELGQEGPDFSETESEQLLPEPVKDGKRRIRTRREKSELLSGPAYAYDEYRRYLRRRGWEYQRRIAVWVVLPILVSIALFAIGVAVKPDHFTAENNIGDIKTLALSNYVLEGMPKDIEDTIQMDRQNFVILSEKPLCTMQELTGAFTGETVSYYPAKISPNTTSSYIISLGIPEFLDISLEKIEKDGAFVIAQTADFTTNTYLTDAYGSSANTRNKLIVVEKQKSHAFGDALSSLLKWFAVFGLLAYFVLLKLGVTENRRRSLY